jgi:hypothetical protein
MFHHFRILSLNAILFNSGTDCDRVMLWKRILRFLLIVYVYVKLDLPLACLQKHKKLGPSYVTRLKKQGCCYRVWSFLILKSKSNYTLARSPSNVNIQPRSIRWRFFARFALNIL